MGRGSSKVSSTNKQKGTIELKKKEKKITLDFESHAPLSVVRAVNSYYNKHGDGTLREGSVPETIKDPYTGETWKRDMGPNGNGFLVIYTNGKSRFGSEPRLSVAIPVTPYLNSLHDGDVTEANKRDTDGIIAKAYADAKARNDAEREKRKNAAKKK